MLTCYIHISPLINGVIVGDVAYYFFFFFFFFFSCVVTTTYFLAASMSSLRTLAVDLPSVDREDDGGALIAHRAIFSHLPDGEISKDKKEQESIGEKEEEDDDEGKTKAELVTRKLSSSSSLEKDDLSLKNMGCQQRRLITESCSFPSPETMEDGFCCLSLQLAPIENTDAVPSRPLLYRAVETRATAV